jgi:hypothetical protein
MAINRCEHAPKSPEWNEKVSAIAFSEASLFSLIAMAGITLAGRHKFELLKLMLHFHQF